MRIHIIHICVYNEYLCIHVCAGTLIPWGIIDAHCITSVIYACTGYVDVCSCSVKEGEDQFLPGRWQQVKWGQLQVGLGAVRVAWGVFLWCSFLFLFLLFLFLLLLLFFLLFVVCLFVCCCYCCCCRLCRCCCSYSLIAYSSLWTMFAAVEPGAARRGA